MPFGGLVVNRAARAAGARRRAAGELVGELGESLARPGRDLGARARRARRPRRRARSRTCASALGDPPVLIVPERQDDVHDVEGLAHVREHLWGAGAVQDSPA